MTALFMQAYSWLFVKGDTNMKKLICLAVLLSVFAFTSTAAAYDPPDPPGAPYQPETVQVEPTLLAMYKQFYPPAVIR